MEDRPPPLPNLRHPEYFVTFRPPSIIIPIRPVFDNEEFIRLKARLVYLETITCRNSMPKEDIQEERRITTEKFKNMLMLPK